MIFEEVFVHVEKVLDFVFPKICRHCEAGWGLLCQECLAYVDFLEVEEKGCHAFEQRACFEMCGPILSLAKEKNPGAVKALAALMVLQYEKLGWPKCDGVVGEGLLGEYFGKMVGMKKLKKPWTDKVLFVASIWPLTYKRKSQLFNKFPKKVLNLSLV